MSCKTAIEKIVHSKSEGGTRPSVCVLFTVTVPIKITEPENHVQHVCIRASRIILAQVRNVLAC